MVRRIVLTLAAAWIGGVAGLCVGAAMVPDGSGLAGPAIAFAYGLFGLGIGALAGVAAAWTLSEERLRPVFTVTMTVALLILTVLSVVVIFQLRNGNPTEPAATPAKPVTAPAP